MQELACVRLHLCQKIPHCGSADPLAFPGRYDTQVQQLDEFQFIGRIRHQHSNRLLLRIFNQPPGVLPGRTIEQVCQQFFGRSINPGFRYIQALVVRRVQGPGEVIRKNL
jgi:hypothetical protein